MGKLLSIIIPTYNMEKYLEKCISSFIMEKEWMNYLEILVVNDGSKDNSSTIAHEFSEKYPEIIRVIDKENGNYGSCVNRGIIEATGKYVKVVDADDYVDKDSLCKLLSSLQNLDVDLVLADYDEVYENEDENKIESLPFEIGKITESTVLFDNKPVCMGMKMHRIAYKLENLRRLNYKQLEGVSYTDQQWMFYPMLSVRTFVYYNYPVYKYLCGREGQTMSIAFYKKAMPQYMAVIMSLIDIYNASIECIDDIHKKYFEYRLESQLGVIYRAYLANGYHIDLRELKEFDNLLKTKNVSLYRMMNEQTILRKYKYVQWWRRFNYKNDYGIITFLFRLTHKELRK